jgi:hypothetical protein
VPFICGRTRPAAAQISPGVLEFIGFRIVPMTLWF